MTNSKYYPLNEYVKNKLYEAKRSGKNKVCAYSENYEIKDTYVI